MINNLIFTLVFILIMSLFYSDCKVQHKVSFIEKIFYHNKTIIINDSNPDCIPECYLNCITQFDIETEFDYCLYTICKCSRTVTKITNSTSDNFATELILPLVDSTLSFKYKTYTSDEIKNKLSGFLLKFVVLSIMFLLIYKVIKNAYHENNTEATSSLSESFNFDAHDKLL